MEFQLFKKDTTGKIRVWTAEIRGHEYRFKTGVMNGAIVESGWREAEAKNVGKVNETTPEQQAISEVQSRYTDQITTGGYFESLEDAKKNIPTFFNPMLAAKYNPKKVVFPTWSQPKFDGMRCIATPTGLFSRRGKEIVSAPHIHESLKLFWEQYPEVTHLDGELYNHELKHDFDKLMSLARKSKPTLEDLAESAQMLKLYVYDIPSGETFENRFVNNLYNYENEFVVTTETEYVQDQDTLDNLYSKYLEDGYEGQMLRYDFDSKGNPVSYENKRSKTLLKRKETMSEEFTVVNIIEGVGNWAGYAKSVTIELPDGSTQEAGNRGNFEKAKELLDNKDFYIGGQVTVNFQNYTPDQKLRFPVVVDWHPNGRTD